MKKDELLDTIFDEVKQLGFVSNQYDFSVMCGRTPAWFSAIKARRLPITSEACLMLSYNITRKASLIVDVDMHCRAVLLSQKLIEDAQKKAREKASRVNGLRE